MPDKIFCLHPLFRSEPEPPKSGGSATLSRSVYSTYKDKKDVKKKGKGTAHLKHEGDWLEDRGGQGQVEQPRVTVTVLKIQMDLV